MQARFNFRVEGAVLRPSIWSVARLGKELAAEVKPFEYVAKGEKRTGRGVSLWSLLQAAGLRADPKVKNHLLGFIAIVRARDGYTATFGLGELSPTEGNRAVWLSFERGGASLSEKDGPVETIVPEDGRPARFVRSVERIVIVDGRELSDPKSRRKAPGVGR